MNPHISGSEDPLFLEDPLYKIYTLFSDLTIVLLPVNYCPVYCVEKNFINVPEAPHDRKGTDGKDYQQRER
jgi:hypothetical protein